MTNPLDPQAFTEENLQRVLTSFAFTLGKALHTLFGKDLPDFALVAKGPNRTQMSGVTDLGHEAIPALLQAALDDMRDHPERYATIGPSGKAHGMEGTA